MQSASEFFHPPGTAHRWNESHYVDGVDESGELAFFFRVGFMPNRDLVNWWGYVISDDRVYWHRDEDIPPSAVHGLVVRRDSFEFRMLPTDSPNEWHLEFEGLMTTNDVSNHEAMLADDGDRREMSFEVTSTPRHHPFHYSRGEWTESGASDRFELATTVGGSLESEERTLSFSGTGERDHSWGPREWFYDRLNHFWGAGSFEDGSAYNCLIAPTTGEEPDIVNGFWFDGNEATAVTGVQIDSDSGLGAETADDWRLGSSPELKVILELPESERVVCVSPRKTTPIPVGSGDTDIAFPRSVAKQRLANDKRGVGWVEHTYPISSS